jgi:glutathione S-transferase
MPSDGCCASRPRLERDKRMALKVYYHPLASFCWKALIALYENDTLFEPVVVDLGNAESREAFAKVWPLTKFPVIRDTTRGQTVAEATVIIEYLDAFYPGPTRFIAADPDTAWRIRMWDRVFDHYIHEPMQKLVADRLRPEGKQDLLGVEQAETLMRQAYELADRQIGAGPWVMGGSFSLVDCAAAPALSYATTLVPLAPSLKNLAAYLDRLIARPSFARVLREAEPYFKFYPVETKPRRA